MNNQLDLLLVEDDPSDATLTLRALSKHNLCNKVVHVTDGQAALDFLFGEGAYAGREIQDQPRLVLLDLKLPKVDGPEILRRIRTDSRTKLIPVVILTSSHEEGDLAESYNLGANSYIVKPVEFENFTKAVSTLGFYWLLVNGQPEGIR